MKKLLFRLIFMFLMSVGVMGSLMACENAKNNEAYTEKTLSVKDKIDVGDYLFNADKMEAVEISGKDLLQKKKVEMSTEIITGTKIDLAIKLDDYNFGFSLIIYSENGGIDMSSNLGESVKGGCTPKEDFCYQMASYDFDHDGKKEIIIAGGNKKDTLELCVFQLDFDLDFDKNEPKKIFEINDGYKAYVNEKDEICVIDYKGSTSVYSYTESGNKK